jgi:hypothetical protein
LISNPQFIHNLRAILDKTHQRILLQIAIQHYLKYGKIDNLVLFNDLIQEQETEISSIQLFEAITKSVQDETIINLIKTYETIEIIINPEVEKQFDEVFGATRYLDYFHQYFETGSTTDWWTNQISKEDLNQNFQTTIQVYPTIVQDIITNVATPKKLLELLNENNLTILMNLLEPNTFGFITTIILTIEKISNRKNAWEIALKTYFNTSKPFDANTFTRQSFLRLAKYANKSYQEITKEVIQYSDEQIKNKQHRYFALKHILQQDIRIKRTPELLLETLESKQNNKTINEHTETSLPIEIIAYFLKYGTLPNTQKKLTEVNMIQFIKKQGIENLNLLKITIQKLLNNTISNNQLKQLPEPILIELIKTLQPKVGSSILEIYNDFKMVIEVGILKISMLEVIQDTTIFSTKSNFAQRYIHNVLTNLATNFNYTYASALIAIIAEFDGKNPTSNIIKQLRRIDVKIKQQERSNTIGDKPVSVVERTITPLKDTAIYIDNAGIVILSVFLPHLFNMFKLIENKKFKDIEASCRAAYMIHYISTGRTEPMEHELVLCKIICNIPLGQPINAVITLTEEEKEGCKQLMKAAIGRWEKVKNSSIEGFRNSFVAREGKLIKTSKGWSLAIEQKPFDLLLKSLPWGIGMVRFGWMDQPVFVDWAY